MHIDLTSVVQESPVKMKFYVLLSLVVGCWGVEWLPIYDFKFTFKEYWKSAEKTISSIENTLKASPSGPEMLCSTFSANPIVYRLIMMNMSKDNCFMKSNDLENLTLPFEMQSYQLQIPLRRRALDIRERLNKIHSTLESYQRLADTKYSSCRSQNGSCLEETNQWLGSIINSLSCTIYPNCSNSLRKRPYCPPDEFSCLSGSCINGHNFCDKNCDCEDCSDEPPGCNRFCNEFRCRDTFRCIPFRKTCDGINDCGNWSDEDECLYLYKDNNFYYRRYCSMDAGDFICDNKKCIGLERVCDGFNDCSDWSDERVHCDSQQCSPECGTKGGVCFTGPKGSQCLIECPPGTYETSNGCDLKPEAPLATLTQVLEDTPRLKRRYEARLDDLKSKTIIALFKYTRDVFKRKKDEFSILSKIVEFSTLIHEEKGNGLVRNEYDYATPRTAVDVTVNGSETPIAEHHYTSQLENDFGRKSSEDVPTTHMAMGKSETERKPTNEYDYVLY